MTNSRRAYHTRLAADSVTKVLQFEQVRQRGIAAAERVRLVSEGFVLEQ